LEIRPLLMFYGIVGFSKALVLIRHQNPLSTLRQGHGVKDVSSANSRIAEIRVKIDGNGTFQDFNDVVAEETRLRYIDNTTKHRAIPLPSTRSDRLGGLELTLREILSRIPGLETLYRMTFGEQPNTDKF